MQYYYDLYGMRILSDLDFMQLEPVRIPENNRGAGWKEIRILAMKEREELQFREKHGTFVCSSFLGTEKSQLCNRTLEMCVERGRVIRYHIRTGGDTQAVRTYLLGFGMAMLSLQQGKLPFHCSALVAPEGGAVLIAGESGAGKSTLTAELLNRGFRFLADDMAVVDVSRNDGMWVYPAFPYMKLCRDAAIRQGYSPEELIYIDEKKDKFLVPCTHAFQREKVRLKCFIYLGLQSEKEGSEETSGNVKTERITGPDSMIVYKDNLFLRHLWKKQDPGIEVWQNCLKIAEQIPVFWIRRPAAGDSTANVAAEVHQLQALCQLKNSSGSSEG